MNSLAENYNNEKTLLASIAGFCKYVNSQSKFYSGQGGGTLFNRKSGIEFNMRSFLPERGK
jgi:hypothetical protein